MRKQDLEFTPIHQHRQRRKEYLNALKDRLCRSHILHPWMYPFSSKGNLKHLPHLPWHSYSKLHTKTKPNVFLTYTVRAACQHLGWIHPWMDTPLERKANIWQKQRQRQEPSATQHSTAWQPTAAPGHWKTYPDTHTHNSAPRDATLHSFQNKQSSCILKYQFKKIHIADYFLGKQAVLILALYRQGYILLHVNAAGLNQLMNIDVNLWKFIVYTLHR